MEEEADFALFDIVKRSLKPRIKVVEVDVKINDQLFVQKAVKLLDELMHKVGQK